MKKVRLIFIAVVFAVSLLPFVGMLWAFSEVSGENRTPAAFPQLMVDGRPNDRYLSQFGTWFNDHFAYRNQAVAANAELRARLFDTSANSQVIIGKDGWLYYEGTLPDYRGTQPLSERALFNIAHNLSLAQRFSEAYGAQFAFTVMPNKNSLYPEHMPGNILPGTQPSNISRLEAYLADEGVHYVDMFEALYQAKAAAPAQALYFERDTHYNEVGALMGYQALAGALGLGDILANAWVQRDDHLGDLDRMLFSVAATFETDSYLPGLNDGAGLSGDTWHYTGEAQSVEAERSTTAGQGSESLVVYRDSGGNSLLPYLAQESQSAVFSKMIPYNLLEVPGEMASAVIVERGERQLPYLSQVPLIVPSPLVDLDTANSRDGLLTFSDASTLEVGENGSLVSFSGVVDPASLEERSLIYVTIQDTQRQRRTYEAQGFGPVDSLDDNGYMVYLAKEALPEGMYSIEVYVQTVFGLTLVECTIQRN